MKTVVYLSLKLFCLLIFVSLANSCVSVSSQSSRIGEVKNKSQINIQAPVECLAVFREFLAYVQKSEPDIVTDQVAQNRWLTKAMREALIEHSKRMGKPEENPDFPSNQTFLGVWNNPTTYSIVGTRHYDFRRKDNPNDNRVIVDVLFEQDDNESLDNQYPGDKRLNAYIFVFENGLWKLDDFYNYESPESLRQYFSKR